MQTLDLKPNHAAVKKYYDALNQYGQLSISHEQAVKTAFHDLLSTCGRRFEWILVPEYKFKGPKGTTLSADAGMVTTFKQLRGLWEAKDGDDNLEKEIKKKFDVGYPKKNIIFQEPQKAILYQGGVRQGLNEDITDPKNLVELVKHFFAYREPHHEEWEHAVAQFKEQVPNLAGALKEIIEKERKGNKRFIESFEAFVLLCQQAINPSLSDEAVETMLIQHLLTERIFRTVFGNPDFSRRNVIAIEIEKVIDALTSKSFNRDKFLQQLDVFYRAIEDSAKDATDYTEKQAFLNTVYERFFQGFSKKEADTHGIVYTPQPIVDFMVRSVEDILQKEFGKSLSDEGVHILDPFVGTGNFITRVMKEIKSTKLRQKYENELHCNEIMLLPYYIASMNIEHEYLERMGEYRPFPGICLVDTFELAEAQQSSLFTAENTERVERQKRSPITVIIANPPYNVGQANENDNNKNRKYEILDKRVARTYGADSLATNTKALQDPYVKAIRWASDRIKGDGVVAFVSNNSFIFDYAYDGMRSNLASDFSSLVHVNLKGNARTSGDRRQREGGNVFDDQIRVSVGITFLIKDSRKQGFSASLFSVDDFVTSTDKRGLLDTAGDFSQLALQTLDTESNYWSIGRLPAEFERFVSFGNKDVKSGASSNATIFTDYSRGTETTRDSWVYNYSRTSLLANVQKTAAAYNQEVDRWKASPGKGAVDNFVTYDDKKIKWSSSLKQSLVAGQKVSVDSGCVRESLYRPFNKEFIYFDSLLNHRQGRLPFFLPNESSEKENAVVCVPGPGGRTAFWAICTNVLPSLSFISIDANQCFPFYSYDEDGTNRRENITDWALEQFREHYKDKKITKWDIFHYTYGVLHDREYRERYAANLKRELPRIPYAPDFYAYAKAGKRLAEIHVEYEKQKQFKMTERETAKPLNWRVTKMRLNKETGTLVYNETLTLSGIPKEVYEYKLGNRSALEWVVDQYQISTDKRSGIVNDPNREDDPEYIYKLIGQVITVSLETVEIVKSLPGLGLPAAEKAASVQ